LVREIATARREGEARHSLQQVLVAALMGVYPKEGYNPASWPRCASLTPHVLAICTSESPGAVLDYRLALLILAARYLHARAAYSAARPLLERALTICENVFGPEHSITANRLTALGHLLETQGDFTTARQLLERALTIIENSPDPSDKPKAASILGILGGIHQQQGDFVAAKPVLERSLAISEEMFGAACCSLPGREHQEAGAPNPFQSDGAHV
jgi:tetratricopeptide (TPR) repeat protein